MNKGFAVVAAAGICLGLLGLSVHTVSGAASPAAPDQSATGQAYKKLTDAVGPAMVTIKFVMKFDGGGSRAGRGERTMEVTGLMMEAEGLVLVSNAKMGGLAARRGMSASATDIRILIGDDTEGLKSKILARDSDLDLCWIQVDDPEKLKGAKSFAAVDFNAESKAEVGDPIYVVDRMGKFFDHALSVEEGRIGGTTKRPRPLLIPAGFGGAQRFLGSPLFSAEGKVVGVAVVQMPDKEDAEGGDSGDGSVAVLILPAAEIVKATVRGKEMAAKQPKEEPKAEEKKDDQKDGMGGDSK